MAPRAVPAACRAIFACWGLPQRSRVDRGHPWGSWHDRPPALALWWRGLGMAVHGNRPRRPQQNGIVARVHGRLDAWGEPATCPDGATWAARVAWVVQTQRERYLVAGYPRRTAACPALATGGRPDAPATEAATWALGRVWVVLAQGGWARRVDKVGRISRYDHGYGVGRADAGQEVWVRFDGQTGEWVVRAADDPDLARHPAAERTTDRIVALAVGDPRPRRHNSVSDRGP